MDGSSKELECVIQTTDGPIRGYIDQKGDSLYYKFKRIPYAKPPLGQLRFRPPSPVTPWTDVIDCTEDAPLPICSLVHNEILGSEDCLYIEVSTKSIKHDKPLPVMFWIGSYVFAKMFDQYLDPSLLNDNGVIFVRCGFRLGPFGFLSINEFEAPGNCGLKDIVMVLKWIQKNINKFGGDPNNVTIFGSSTGGAMVHLLMLSPMASGLFHKAIIQSSSVLNNWSLTKNPSLSVMELSKKLNIKELNKIEIVEQLRSFPAEDIITASSALQDELNKVDQCNVFDAYFKPCIEVDLEGLPSFLTKSPILILKSGNFNKVPIIIGSNNIEGSVLEYIAKDFYDDFQKYNEDVRLIVPKSLSCDAKLSVDIGRKLKNFYLGDGGEFCANTRTQYLQLISDYYFLYYVNKAVRLHSEFAPECPVFYYIVNCAGEWCVPEELQFLNNLGHSAEIAFMFLIKSSDQSDYQICKGTKDSVVTRSKVTKMWTNFAKYGNPTPNEEDELLKVKWDHVETKDKLNYLSIGTELTKGTDPFHARMTFWDQLHKEYTFLRMLTYFSDLGVSW